MHMTKLHMAKMTHLKTHT